MVTKEELEQVIDSVPSFHSLDDGVKIQNESHKAELSTALLNLIKSKTEHAGTGN